MRRAVVWRRRERGAAGAALWLGLMLAAATGTAAAQAAPEPCRARLLADCSPHHALEADRPNYVVLGKAPGPPQFEEQSDEEYELALQISARMQPTALVPLYVSYTQRSFYIFSCCSSPFRAHVYNPEVYLDLERNPLALDADARNGWGFRGGRVGLEHESNGESKIEGNSVGWNRLYGELKLAYGAGGSNGLDFTEPGPGILYQRREPEFFTLRWRVWLPWTTSPGDVDLADYYGYTRLAAQVTTDAQQLSVSLRRGRLPDTLTTIVNYAFAPPAWLEANVMFLLQYFNGVGETLDRLDERHTHWRFGIQISR